MKILRWLPLIIILPTLAPARLNAQEPESTFSLVACHADPHAVVLAFTHSDGRVRSIAFGDDGEFALKTESAKGLLRFSYTVAIHLRQLRTDGEDRLMTIEYRLPRDQENQTLEFGILDSNCLKILRDRYDKVLKFEEGK